MLKERGIGTKKRMKDAKDNGSQSSRGESSQPSELRREEGDSCKGQRTRREEGCRRAEETRRWLLSVERAKRRATTSSPKKEAGGAESDAENRAGPADQTNEKAW